MTISPVSDDGHRRVSHPLFVSPLVIGASGLVGGAIYCALREHGYSPIGTYKSNPKPGLVPFSLEGDIAPFLERHAPSVVFIASALTNVDDCESHEEETMARNVRALEPVVRYCMGTRTPLVFFSTDYVFDGAAGPYDEDATPNPLNVYGRSKLLGERLVATLPRHAIIRITNVFDIGHDTKNYAHRVVSCLRDRRAVIVPNDQSATPTYAGWLAEQLIALIERGALLAEDGPASRRVLHISCDESISREEFGKRIARLVGADESLIRGVPTIELKQAAARPMAGGLKNDALKALLGVRTLSVDDALGDLAPKMLSYYKPGTSS